MANKEHLELLKKGIQAWNAWRKINTSTKPDLRKADLMRSMLSEANLRGADLSDANLFNVDLSGAILIGADFRRASLDEADLRGANLRGANLSGANLTRAGLSLANLMAARLSEANLSGANLRISYIRGAYLTKTNLTGANIGSTVFGDVNLSTVQGLESCVHDSSSIIDHGTLRQSGPLPLSFLRGCGLSDWEIESTKLYQAKSERERTDIMYKVLELQRDSPISFYSVFISYTEKDLVFAERLYADLQNKGIRCWFAPEDMKIGDRVLSTVDEAIRLRDKLIVILSEHSIERDWVEYEVSKALKEEKERQTNVLFPIRLDDAVMNTEFGWAKKIRTAHLPGGRYIGDFRSWKDHDTYQKSFERLLRDLSIEKLPENKQTS